MKNIIIDFLKKQYGQRLDYPQPMIVLDVNTLGRQLMLLQKNIVRTKFAGLNWLVVGILQLILSALGFYVKADVTSMSQLVIGLVFTVSGVWYVFRHGELKRKKAVLETMAYVNQL